MVNSSQGVPTTRLPPPPNGTGQNQGTSGGSYLGYVIVAIAAWLLFFDGYRQLLDFKPPVATNTTVVVTATAAAIAPGSQSIPTAIIKTQPAGNAVVVPSKPYESVPSPIPLPTEVPPAAIVQNAASYALITTPPTPYPTPECSAQNSTYVTDPVTVLNEKGIPIGSVQGWSCESAEAAVASVHTLSEQMIAQWKAANK
jgi:hypothetical protein